MAPFNDALAQPSEDYAHKGSLISGTHLEHFLEQRNFSTGKFSSENVGSLNNLMLLNRPLKKQFSDS